MKKSYLGYLYGAAPVPPRETRITLIRRNALEERLLELLRLYADKKRALPDLGPSWPREGVKRWVRVYLLLKQARNPMTSMEIRQALGGDTAPSVYLPDMVDRGSARRAKLDTGRYVYWIPK